MNHGKKTFLLALASAVVLSGCSGSGQQMTAYDAQYLDYFDTVTSITIYAKNEAEFEQYKSLAEDTMKKYHELFDIYDNYDGVSNIKTINDNAGIAPVTVDPELISLLEFSRQEYEKTGGRVNVAMGSVLSIWHEYREAGLDDPENAKLPPMEDLQAAAQHMNIDDLILDEAAQTVYFADPEMKLDVGAVAKGYATEIVSQMLLAGDMPSFIISAGGNVRMGNPPADGRTKWGVGIQDPDGAVLGLSDIVETLYVTGCSVVTSGDYQRYYVVDGQRYHHLIDPDTLMPDTDFRSVSIITEDSGYADLLSTAAFLMPYEESRAFVDSLDGVEAIWLFPDGSKKMTFGAMNVAKSCGATNQ